MTCPERVGSVVEEASELAAARGALQVAMAVANRARLHQLWRSLDNGANAAVLPIFNIASLVGFGAVVASLSAFGAIRDAAVGVGVGDALISLAVAVRTDRTRLESAVCVKMLAKASPERFPLVRKPP